MVLAFFDDFTAEVAQNNLGNVFQNLHYISWSTVSQESKNQLVLGLFKW